MNSEFNFKRPMQPHPALKGFERSIQLPKSKLIIYYYDAGDSAKPAALFLHGLGDEADTWHGILGPLSEKWRVIAPDLPGFGRSENPMRSLTKAYFTGLVLELLEALEIRCVLLLGHSLGAVLAHQIALDHPDQARGLVLIDGSLLMKSTSFSLTTMLFLVPKIGELLYKSLQRDPQAAYRSLFPFYSDLNRLPVEEREFLFQRVNERVWSDTQMRAYFSTLRNFSANAVRQPKGQRERLKSLAVPTLVFWGAEDDIYSIESGKETVSLQPDARLIQIPEAGHNCHQEKPDWIFKGILEDKRFRTDW